MDDTRGPLLALVGLAVLASAAVTAPTASAAGERDRCEQADELFPWPRDHLRLRRGAVYQGLSDWYEHGTEDASPTSYEVRPLLGDADLRVWDAECPQDPVCVSQTPGLGVEVCEVPGQHHVVEVQGAETLQPGAGVHYLVHVRG